MFLGLYDMKLFDVFPKFSKKQINKLSDITSDIALISLASVVLPALLDELNIVKVVLGLIITIMLWIISLHLTR